jgi:hypothetical protein
VPLNMNSEALIPVYNKVTEQTYSVPDLPT